MATNMTDDILYLVMPAYNEEENIENVVREWYGIVEGINAESRLLVADSGSNDRTHEILTKLQVEFPQLEILEDSMKQHGPKLIALYNYAIGKGADYVFQTDSDGQTKSEEFDLFWRHRHDYVAIIGDRTKRGDGFIRKLVEDVLCLILRLYFGVRIPDANAPFRLFKVDVLKKYMSYFEEDYNLPNAMLVVFLKYYNENISFERITFENRKAGKNSINIPRICRIGFKALKDFGRFRKAMR